jgi:peptidoglycan lytic transglycosylase G
VLTPAPALGPDGRVFEIPAHGGGVLEISRRLRDEGVIRSRAAFVVLSALRGSARRLRAGEYQAPAGATTLDVLTLLESGRVRQHLILHREGDTVADLARALEAERLASAADVRRVASDPRFTAGLGIEAASVEGYLFPDTYQFVRGMTVEDILGRMVQRLRAKLTPELVARAGARGLTVHAILTLASIIEREAAVPEERRLISAVFWNRLRRDMPLQADPTVQFALGKDRRPLSRADLLVEHPYNTYRRPGLPPGPIASPGLAAIEAALDPAPVNYLYFVAVDETRHHFSTSLEEHHAAVARLRQRSRAESRVDR